ncbi:MAG: YkgJ family cysteine cluster protein [Bacteroidota bacterium]
MEDIVKGWKEKSQKNYDLNLSFLTSIRGKSEWDEASSAVHKEVFEKADCLKCANCCKTTPAIVERSDIKRIAKFLGIPPKSFIRKYLLEDIGGGMVIQCVPCTFLNSDNTCQIYEVRPKACREYPHTDQEDFHRRAKMNAKNTIVCPAAFEIVERLRML